MRSNRLFCALAAACLAGAAFVSAAADRVVGALSRGFDRLLCAWVEPFQAQAKPPGQETPRLALVISKAFVLRLFKRERPRVTPRWRMCPSA